MADMDKVMAETLWHLDAECEEAGWDMPDQLMMVLIHPMDGRVGLVEMKTMPGWDTCTAVAPGIQEALALMALMMAIVPAEVKAETFPPEFYGLALITEAWMIRQPFDATPEQRAIAKKALAEHRLSEHPDRIETRFVFCISTQGTLSALNHERDGIVEAFDPADGALGGGVPDLMAALVSAIKE